MPGDQQQGNAEFSSPVQQLSIIAVSLHSFHPRKDRETFRSHQPHCLPVLKPKKILLRKMTVCSMTVPCNCVKVNAVILCVNIFLRLDASHFFDLEFTETQGEIYLVWMYCSSTPSLIFPFLFKVIWKVALVKRLVSHINLCLNCKPSLKPKIRQVVFVPALIQRCYTTQKNLCKKIWVVSIVYAPLQ